MSEFATRVQTRFYLWIKRAWLLYLAAILPLTAVHLSVYARKPVSPSPRGFLLYFLGAVFLVLWLIAQSLLGMSRFPLETRPALRLVSASYLQILIVLLLGSSWTYPFYLAFLTTLAAIVILVLIGAGWKCLAPPRSLGKILLFFVFPIFTAPLFWFLLPPLISGLAALRPWQIALEITVIAGTIGILVRTLHGLSIFARPTPLDPLYYREWERWAAPTIIILILSATAAILIFAISTATGK